MKTIKANLGMTDIIGWGLMMMNNGQFLTLMIKWMLGLMQLKGQNST